LGHTQPRFTLDLIYIPVFVIELPVSRFVMIWFTWTVCELEDIWC